MIQCIDGPEQDAELKWRIHLCVLEEEDHQRNKNLIKPLSTSSYSPSPVKEDEIN